MPAPSAVWRSASGPRRSSTRGLPETCGRACRDLASDPDAEYCEVIEIDAATIRPMVALPGDPGNGKYVDELPGRVKVEIAYAGSCTAGKKEDMDMYARVLQEAVERGEHV